MAKEEKKDKFVVHQELVATANEFREHSERTKERRRILNQKNWNVYLGQYRFKKKKKGMSNTFLHKQTLATEQITALFKSAIVNFDKWLEIEEVGGAKDPLFTPELVKALMRSQMEQAKIRTVYTDGIKTGLQEGNMTFKIGGEMVQKDQKNRQWQLKVWLVPFEDLHRDETGEDLLIMQDSYVDKFRLLKRKESDGYMLDKIKELQGYSELDQDRHDKDQKRGNMQGMREFSRRTRCKVTEVWGTIIDTETGDVMKDENGEPLENVVYLVGNEKEIIRKPMKNPRWSGKHPFIRGRILRVPFSDFDKAVMDAGSDLNITLSELFNLMIDGGFAHVFGVRQIRPDLLADPKQISNGLSAHATLILKKRAPINAKVVETVTTGSAPNEIFPLFNTVASLFAENVFADVSLLGAAQNKRTLATEVVASNQAISLVFDSLSNDFEEETIVPMATQCWQEILQNLKEFPEDELVQLIADSPEEEELARQQIQEINKLTPRQRFDRAGQHFRFKGKGLKTMAARIRDLNRIQTLLSIITNSPEAFNEFKRDYSFGKLTKYLFRILELDDEEFAKTAEQKQQDFEMEKMKQQILTEEQARRNAQPAGPGGNPPLPAAQMEDVEQPQ